MLMKTGAGRIAGGNENLKAVNPKAETAADRKTSQALKAGNNLKLPGVNVAMPRKGRAVGSMVSIAATEAREIVKHPCPKIVGREGNRVRQIVNTPPV
jgi:hypothetical protein